MSRESYIVVRLRDRESFDAIREILRYEAAVRGKPMGTTAYDMVMGSIDIESYPEEVREQLARALLEAESEASEEPG